MAWDFSDFIEEEIEEYKQECVSAYNQLQLMMRRGEKLTIKFYTCRKDNTPCAWIESRNVAGFRYILKPETIDGIFNYLKTGDQCEFDINPGEYKSLEDDEDFQKEILFRLLDSGKNIQWVPLFREYHPQISGFASFKMGKIIFRLERNDEILGELREYKQAI